MGTSILEYVDDEIPKSQGGNIAVPDLISASPNSIVKWAMINSMPLTASMASLNMTQHVILKWLRRSGIKGNIAWGFFLTNRNFSPMSSVLNKMDNDQYCNIDNGDPLSVSEAKSDCSWVSSVMSKFTLVEL